MLLLYLAPLVGASAGISAWEQWEAASCGAEGVGRTDQMSILCKPAEAHELCLSLAFTVQSERRFQTFFLRKHEQFVKSGKRDPSWTTSSVCSRMCCHGPFPATQVPVASGGWSCRAVSCLGCGFAAAAAAVDFWGVLRGGEQRAFVRAPFAWKPTCAAAVLCI